MFLDKNYGLPYQLMKIDWFLRTQEPLSTMSLIFQLLKAVLQTNAIFSIFYFSLKERFCTGSCKCQWGYVFGNFLSSLVLSQVVIGICKVWSIFLQITVLSQCAPSVFNLDQKLMDFLAFRAFIYTRQFRISQEKHL